MGMHCVAVFADDDAAAPFVSEADQAVRIGSYLDGEAIIAAALRTRAQAIHPGYGFLSENAAFAQAVTDAGLVWVGPRPEVIASMGDKLRAKEAAEAAGVPTLPSSSDPSAGDSVGYPLLVKAAAGGGGKGMRIVQTADGLAEAVASAQREALSGFGDDTVFLERYVAASRHVEIQILGDTHGNLVHLGERECSIQRRHQKIIEEAPSPVVDASLREAMGNAAIALASRIGYESAGTVEFLVDNDTREFWFLEVNTRLQVEHPVTEEVTGVDLVRAQLLVASGAELEFDQSDISFTGHAIEARLYAEDPSNDFLPAIGTIDAWEPAATPAVRWDSGVANASVVGVNFDPMLAKVTASGPTRSEAAGRLARALERLHLGGVVTNRDFLVSTLRSDGFLRGDTTTDFIERHQPQRQRSLSDDELGQAAAAAALWVQGRNRSGAPVLGNMPSGFRVARTPDELVVLRSGDRSAHVRYRRQRDGDFRVTVTAATDTDEPPAEQDTPATQKARIHNWSPTSIDIEVDGHRYQPRITATTTHIHVQTADSTVSFEIVPRFVPPTADVSTGGLVAPMPGTVLDVQVAPGDKVTKGQTLVILEAMKMEHHLTAPIDGTVAEVRVEVGTQVDNGALVVVFEDDSSTGETEASP